VCRRGGFRAGLRRVKRERNLLLRKLKIWIYQEYTSDSTWIGEVLEPVQDNVDLGYWFGRDFHTLVNKEMLAIVRYVEASNSHSAKSVS
jgi:hypothetical protein